MAHAEQKRQGDGGRFVGTTWQDLLDLETVDGSRVPESPRATLTWAMKTYR